MGDETPLQTFAEGRAGGASGFAEAAGTHEGGTFHLEVAKFVGEFELLLGGLVAIGAGNADGEHLRGWARGLEIRVEQREIDFGAVVVAFAE